MKKFLSNKWMLFAYIIFSQIITYIIPNNNIPIYIYIIELCILFLWARYLAKIHFKDEPKALKIIPRILDLTLFAIVAYTLVSNNCFNDPGICLTCDKIAYIKRNFATE